MAVGIFDSINTTETHNLHFKSKYVQLYSVSKMFCDTTYNSMIKIQASLYKTSGVVSVRLPTIR